MNATYIIQPADQNEVIVKSINIYSVGKEVCISLRRIAYFRKHIPRCKKQEDMFKLLGFLMVEQTFCAKLIGMLKKMITDLIDAVFPKLKRGNQLLLNAGL
jgi:hypothetical protein